MKSTNNHFEIGTHYLIYRRMRGSSKKVFIFMYDTICTEIWKIYSVDYSDSYIIVNTEKGDVFEGDSLDIFKLNPDEKFRHFDMEIITENL